MENVTVEMIKALKSKRSFSEYVEMNPAYMDCKLHEVLTLLLEEKQLEKAAVIKDSGLDRHYGYQIFSGTKNPSKDKLLAIAIGMKLSYEETQNLLKVANLPELYAKRHRDSMIIFSLHNQMGILETNELLFEMGEKIIE